MLQQESVIYNKQQFNDDHEEEIDNQPAKPDK